ACVFVRYLADNDLIDDTYLAGATADRRREADDAHQAYFDAHPHDTDRDYLLHVFRRVGSIKAAADLYAEGKTPVWAVGPSGDGAKRLLTFWKEVDPGTGALKRSFRAEGATPGSSATSTRTSPSTPARSTPCCRRPTSSSRSSSTTPTPRPSTSSGWRRSA